MLELDVKMAENDSKEVKGLSIKEGRFLMSMIESMAASGSKVSLIECLSKTNEGNSLMIQGEKRWFCPSSDRLPTKD